MAPSTSLALVLGSECVEGSECLSASDSSAATLTLKVALCALRGSCVPLSRGLAVRAEPVSSLEQWAKEAQRGSQTQIQNPGPVSTYSVHLEKQQNVSVGHLAHEEMTSVLSTLCPREAPRTSHLAEKNPDQGCWGREGAVFPVISASLGVGVCARGKERPWVTQRGGHY